MKLKISLYLESYWDEFSAMNDSYKKVCTNAKIEPIVLIEWDE